MRRPINHPVAAPDPFLADPGSDEIERAALAGKTFLGGWIQVVYRPHPHGEALMPGNIDKADGSQPATRR